MPIPEESLIIFWNILMGGAAVLCLLFLTILLLVCIIAPIIALIDKLIIKPKANEQLRRNR